MTVGCLTLCLEQEQWACMDRNEMLVVVIDAVEDFIYSLSLH